MAKCENCYHKQACMGIYSRASWALNTIEENNCEHFKDKSLVAELPCMVGDKVYRIPQNNHGHISEFTVVAIHLSDEKTIRKKLHKSHFIAMSSISWLNGKFNFDDFGETIFHSRKEAVKALEGKG